MTCCGLILPLGAVESTEFVMLNGVHHDKVATTNLGQSWYDTLRMLHGFVEGSECAGRIPLECNFDLLNSIDFHKGCYVGQELTARTKHRVGGV